jgi:outer membrane protein TolC
MCRGLATYAAAAAMTIGGLLGMGDAIDTALHAQTQAQTQSQTPPASQQPPPSPTPPSQMPQPGNPAPTQPVAPLPPPTAVNEKVTFQDAVARALQRNPSVQEAASDILRAEALLRQARSVLFPQASGSISTTVSTPVIEFNGAAITPRTQTAFGATASQWIYAPVQWALRNQAADQVNVSQRALDEAKRQIALSAAEAYLTIITNRRLVDVSQVAAETAKAHFDYAHQLQEKGAGSRLNELRAQRDYSRDESTLENARIAVYRAQEALGVLLAATGPVDITEEPALTLPEAPDTAQARVAERADVKLVAAQEQAALRVVNDSWKEYLPEFNATFTPQYVTPSGLFAPSWTTKTMIGMNINLFDSGTRAARKAQREADLSRTRLAGDQTRRQAASEIRTAIETVRIAERSMAAARDAASQAHQVVDITNIAFRAGATTNIEVIDAQREARDADNAAAIAEDTLRRARLDLLVSTGRFP